MSNLSSDDYRAILALSPDDLLKRCERRNYQASGAGGQKRNRVLSAVRLTLSEPELTVTAGEFREAQRNLQAALGKLRLNLALEGASLVAMPPPNGSESELESRSGSESEQEKGIAGAEEAAARLLSNPPGWPDFRLKVNPEHRDYPNFVYTALALLRLYRGDVAGAARALHCTSSALIRFYKLDKQVFAAVNDLRVKLGAGKLR